MRALVLLAALVGATVLMPSADARPKERFGVGPPDVGRQSESLPDSLIDRRSHMSPSQAAREAQMRYGGGKVLSVDEAGGGYRVKLVRDGDVRVVFIPDR